MVLPPLTVRKAERGAVRKRLPVKEGYSWPEQGVPLVATATETVESGLKQQLCIWEGQNQEGASLHLSYEGRGESVIHH